MNWLYILVIILVVLTALYVLYRLGSRPSSVTGGACGMAQPGRKLRPGKNCSRLPPEDPNELVEIKVELPRKNIRKWLTRFRESAKECTVVNAGDLCQETVEYYKRLRKELIEKDPANADKIIVQRHFSENCPFCIASIPTWSSIVNEYLNGGENRKYIFINNDEDTSRTPGIREVPTVIKFDGQKICRAGKTRDYDALKKFIESD
jgi:hypothetical protein